MEDIDKYNREYTSIKYCTFNKQSDIYMIKSIYNILVCCVCNLGGANTFKLRSEAIRHLNKHRLEGDRVPIELVEALNKEIEEYGDKVL